jgi:signal transduction histidine kinase
VRELGLAALIAAATWAAIQLSFDSTWTFLDRAPYSVWAWLLLASTSLLCALRLRFPAVAFLAAATLFGAWPATGGILALTAFHAAANVRPARRLQITIALAVVLDCAIALPASLYGWTITLAGHLTALLVCVGLPIGVQLLLGKADGLIAALRDRTHYLEANYRLAHSAARLQERSRIAQEMHDQLGHRLSLISLYTGALELATATQAPAVADDARLIRGTVNTAMQELRTILDILRAADQQETQLHPVDETGTRADLARLVAQSRSAGIRVELAWLGSDLAGAALPVRRAAHRLVREGLTNIHRHALGAASRVAVDCRTDRVRVEVLSGRPPSPAPSALGNGLGLVGVQERVLLIGGTFSAGATLDGGFHLLAELPLTDPTTPSMITAPPAAANQERAAVRRRLGDTWGVAAVLTASLAGIPTLVSIALYAVSLVVPGSSPFDSPPEIETPRLGMSRDEVRDLVGDGDPVARMAAGTVEMPPPPDTACLYVPDSSESIVRYCFRADRLVVIDKFPIR